MTFKFLGPRNIFYIDYTINEYVRYHMGQCCKVSIWDLCNLVTQQWLCNALYKRNPFSNHNKSRIFHYYYRLLMGLCQQSMSILIKKVYPKFHCHAKSLFLCSLHRAVCNALFKSAKLYLSPQGNSAPETLY